MASKLEYTQIVNYNAEEHKQELISKIESFRELKPGWCYDYLTPSEKTIQRALWFVEQFKTLPPSLQVIPADDVIIFEGDYGDYTITIWDSEDGQ